MSSTFKNLLILITIVTILFVMGVVVMDWFHNATDVVQSSSSSQL